MFCGNKLNIIENYYNTNRNICNINYNLNKSSENKKAVKVYYKLLNIFLFCKQK